MKACLLLVVILAWAGLADAKENSGLERPWWSIVSITREQDAAVSAKLELRLPYKMESVENIEVYCGLTPWKRDKAELKYGPREFYKVYPDVDNGRLILTVRSWRTEQVEIWARIKTAEHIDFAGTIYRGYGKAPPGATRPEILAAAPDWPSLNLDMGPKFSRAQTGANIVLQPSHGFFPDTVTVFKDGWFAASLKKENGKYNYTPPHDEELSKRGSAAWKSLAFLAHKSGGIEAVTFALPLYRSHYGYINLPGGLLVICIGTFGALAVVLLMNKTFRWR